MGWNVRGPDDLDEDERARIRYHVMSSLRGRHTTLGDRMYDAFALVALPAPHLVRLLVVGMLVLGIIGTATVASAESLPDDALYGLKLASEQLRLALALAPEDRAAVELSMAEHRLAEAQQLAFSGRTSDALVATSAYGEHLANAAAALATVERLDPAAGPVVDQLRLRLVDQQKRASDIAAHLGADPTSQTAPVFRTIASLAPLAAGGTRVSVQIAEHAAAITEKIAGEAERLANGGQPVAHVAPAITRSPEATRTPEPTRAPARTDAPRPVGAGQPARTPAIQPTTAPRETAQPVATPTATPVDRAAVAAAEKARQEAEKAREAANKAKDEAKKTATPTPTPRH